MTESNIRVDTRATRFKRLLRHPLMAGCVLPAIGILLGGIALNAWNGISFKQQSLKTTMSVDECTYPPVIAEELKSLQERIDQSMAKSREVVSQTSSDLRRLVIDTAPYQSPDMDSFRAKLLSQAESLDETWRNSLQSGLHPEMSSWLHKLMYEIAPTGLVECTIENRAQVTIDDIEIVGIDAEYATRQVGGHTIAIESSANAVRVGSLKAGDIAVVRVWTSSKLLRFAKILVRSSDGVISDIPGAPRPPNYANLFLVPFILGLLFPVIVAATNWLLSRLSSRA